MGMFDDLIPEGPKTPAAGGAGMFDDLIPKEKPFLEKLGNFASKVWNDPPPSIAAARDVIKGAPQAATELTWGADPEAAREAAGTIAQAAGLGLGFKGPGGTNVGVAGRPITAEARNAPIIAPRPIPAPTAADAAVEAAARGGYTVPNYIATEGTVIPQVASSVKNVPWAGQPITRVHDELLANMGRSKSEIAPLAGTPETAGERAKSGLSSFITTESKKPVSSAYEAVDAMVNPEIRAPLENTQQAVADIMAKRTNARMNSRSGAVDMVLDAVQDPRGMNYAGVKDLRTSIGEKTPMELATQGIAKQEYDRIYSALSKDLGNTVREAGGPDAFAAWHKANRLASLTKAQQNALSKVIGTKGDAAPEMVFERLATFANSKRGADLNRLQLAKQAMGPSAWGDVGAAMIDRLGMAPDGSFSPQRFVTAFGNMAPAARNELFSGRQHAALQDLFIVSKHIGDRITRFGNPSGTARGGIVGQAVTGGALFAEPLTVLTTLVGTRLAAEALSRPAIVRAATAVSRASLARNPVRTQRALNALSAVIAAEGLAARQPQQEQPQFAGPQLPFRQGEQMDNLMASINGAQGYPDFKWVNPAGVDAFLASGPMSTNIEDRRDELGGFDAAAARMRRQGRR